MLNEKMLSIINYNSKMDKNLLDEKYEELARFQKERYAIGSEIRKVNRKFS